MAVEVADGKEVTPIVSGDGSTTSWTWPTETHCRTQQDSNNTRLAAAIPQRPDLSGSCKTFSNVPNSDPGDDPRGRMPAVTEQLTRYEKPSPCRPPATRFDAFPGARPEQIGILVKTRVINSNDEPCRHQLRHHHNDCAGQIRDIYLSGAISEFGEGRSNLSNILRIQPSGSPSDDGRVFQAESTMRETNQ